jgi:hypothetical protein
LLDALMKGESVDGVIDEHSSKGLRAKKEEEVKRQRWAYRVL